MDRHSLTNKAYFDPFDKQLFEVEEGILYYAKEPAAMNISQLRRRVVPKSLQHVVIIAFHSSPMAGHVGFYKTYFRIAIRYWWARMYSDIREAVIGCAHCALTNATSHESQQIIQALSFDVPFDVISMDIWNPGRVTTKYNEVKVLTSLDAMTGFASADFMKAEQVNSDQLTRRAYAAFFIPNGLPKLVLIDQGSENKGHLVNMCQTMHIHHHVVAPEQHNGILCERFHRFLNKVQKINAADTQSFTQWVQGTLFALYAWNASPIDGTDIMRSFAAKARVFPFPFEITQDHVDRVPPTEGEPAIEHLETIFPLWGKQSMLLQILQEERRERHRDMKNQGVTQRKFNVGDIVLVKKQVKSQTVDGQNFPEKQRIGKFKGPYKVVEKLSEKSYHLRRLPAVKGKGKPGRLRKAAASHMNKIPSTLVVHKRLQGQDNTLASMETRLVQNPLEQALGFHEFGKYVQVPDQSKFAFDKIEDMWSQVVESSSDEDDEDRSTNGSDDETTESCESESRQVEDIPEGDRKPAAREKRAHVVEDSNQDRQSEGTGRARRPDDETDRHKPRKRQKTTVIELQNSPREPRRDLTLTALYAKVKDSKDKLFFIKEGPQWHLIQVDWDETRADQAREAGMYSVRWYTRHHVDAESRLTKDCRFWPLIRELNRDESFGAIRPVAPGKVTTMIKSSKRPELAWYQRKVDLYKLRLVGPFDFSTKKRGNRTEHYRVDDSLWTELIAQAQHYAVDTTNVTRVWPTKPYRRGNHVANSQET